MTNKDNIKFETDAKTSVTFLIIPKVMPSHIGTYTIKASNNVGEVEHSFTFDALGDYYLIYKSQLLLKFIQTIFVYRNTKDKWKIRKCHSE